MDMLTEVMSLMLLNKNDDVVKYASNLDKIDSDAQLPHPNMLRKKRGRKTSDKVDKEQDGNPERN